MGFDDTETIISKFQAQGSNFLLLTDTSGGLSLVDHLVKEAEANFAFITDKLSIDAVVKMFHSTREGRILLGRKNISLAFSEICSGI